MLSRVGMHAGRVAARRATRDDIKRGNVTQGRIQLHHSNRTESLLEALVGHLERERAHSGPSRLRPTLIVVPDRNVETWLKLGVARSLGIAANLEVSLLRRFVAGHGATALGLSK